MAGVVVLTQKYYRLTKKRRPKSGGGEVAQCGQGSQMQTPHFLAQQTSDCLNLLYPHGQGGRPGGEVNFSGFCADVFYESPLTLLDHKI